MSSLLRAYVIKSASIAYDLFYTLPLSFNPPQAADFQYAKLMLDSGYELELIPDVQAEHKITAAIFLIKSTKDVDLSTRLALLNACQQGVYKFIFLHLRSDDDLSDNQNKYNPNSPLAKLLAELTISSEDVSFLYLPVKPGEGHKITQETRSLMKKLITLLKEKLLQPPLSANDFQLPDSFRVEDQLLTLIHPLVKPATIFTETLMTLDESRSKPVGAHDLAVKSHRGGVPYLEQGQELPRCKCGVTMDCLFQINTKDLIHHTAELYGIYTVFKCANFHSDLAEISKIYHHPESSLQRWRDVTPLDLESEEDEPSQALVPQRLCFTLPYLCTPHVEMISREFPTLMNDLHALYPALQGDWIYEEIRTSLGMKSLQISDHGGGWDYPGQGHALSVCEVCQRPQALVVQLAHGDWWYGLWACTEHPAAATLLFYR